MATRTQKGNAVPPSRSLFADLRRRNEYRSRVGRLLAATRERRIDDPIRSQRKRRVHQAR